MIGGRNELARRLRSMRRDLDRNARRAAERRIEQMNLGAALIDDALAVGLCVPDVVVVVIRVAPHIGPVRQARIKIADALGIGEVMNAVADPHRAGQIALELVHPPERPGTGCIDP
jgi:hypothetical protein